MLAPMKTVLLAEDVEEDRRVVRQIVNRMLNVKLIIAGNGAEAVSLARRIRPQVILMDLSLPVSDAWSAISQLKADPRTADLPIIAMTAHAMYTEEQRSRQVGCAGYLVKPIRAEVLEPRLKAFLGEGA